ncbi:MAG: ORF6N domain-containing protein [Alphaproteobacteria bacterium]|nr:ORF6N domain-containing protein [Alphaproteobacteria bacterium]
MKTMKAVRASAIVLPQRIEQKIILIRGHKVLIDSDLAELYGVETKMLLRQVRRNISRFPEDFMMQLTLNEWDDLRCQFGTSSSYGGRRYLPYVFTEQGVSMLSSVLNSERAIEVNIQIMRAFVKLRKMLSSHKELARKIDEMEKQYDHQFAMVFDAIKKLMQPQPLPKKRKIGYIINDD